MKALCPSPCRRRQRLPGCLPVSAARILVPGRPCTPPPELAVLIYFPACFYLIGTVYLSFQQRVDVCHLNHSITIKKTTRSTSLHNLYKVQVFFGCKWIHIMNAFLKIRHSDFFFSYQFCSSSRKGGLYCKFN